MLEYFTYDFLLQLCQEVVEGKQVKTEGKKIDYQLCQRNAERMMYPHQNGSRVKMRQGSRWATVVYPLKEWN